MKETSETISPPYDVVAASLEDAEGIFNVQRVTWIDTYPNEAAGIMSDAVRTRIEGEHGELIQPKIERWRKTIEEGSRDVFVAKSSGTVLGFVAPHYDQENDQYRLGALYVLPETQGSGIGSALIQRALDHIGEDKDVYLHVVTYNQNAIQFYENKGFVKTGQDVTGSVAPLPGGMHLPEIEMVRPAKG